MGGSSRTQNQASQTTNNTNISYGIQDGVGIWGDGNTYDNSMTEIFADVSDRRVTENHGQFAGMNNSGRITVTDGGAFSLARDVTMGAFDVVGDVSNNALGRMENVSFGAMDLADRVTSNAIGGMRDTSIVAMDTTAGVSQSAMAGMQNVSYAAISANTELAGTSILSGNALARDLAAESNLLARESILTGGLLGTQLMEHVANMGRERDQFTTDTTRYALQFADNVSRSDGQQLAVSTNKTVMYIGLAAAAAVIVIQLGKK